MLAGAGRATMTDAPLTDDARTLLAILAERGTWEVAELRKRLG